MTATDTRPGMLLSAFRRILMRQATVSAREDLGGHFRLISLEGEQLRGAEWVPGQKIQIAMGATFATRTYTPIEWNAETGSSRILGYAHGDWPGSLWLRRADVGDRCDLFGPRASLDVSKVTGPLAVFGDETSIALACAFGSNVPARAMSCHLEVGDLADTRRVLARLGLSHAQLFARDESDDHIAQMEAGLSSLAADGATFVLTGRAPAIQRLRQRLRQLDVPSARVMTKAYWSPGKAGLD